MLLGPEFGQVEPPLVRTMADEYCVQMNPNPTA